MANFKPEYTHSLVEKRSKNPKTAQELRNESKQNGITDYAKEKIAKNIKIANAVNKAKAVKEDFENRMGVLKENVQEEPEDDESPDNLNDRSLGKIAKQRLKTEGNKQLRKGKEYAKGKLDRLAAQNPKTAATLKEAREKAEAFKKRRSEEIKKLAESKNKIAKRINKLANAKKLIKKKIADEAKKLALKIAQAATRLAVQIMAAVISALSEVIVIILIVIVIFVVIIAAVDYTCNSTVGEPLCQEIAGWF